MYTKLKSYSTNAIAEIFPLDRTSIGELVDYALSLRSDHEIQIHFLELFGESDASLAFVTKFLRLKLEAELSEKAKSEASHAEIKHHQAPLTSNTAWAQETGSKKQQAQKGRLNKSTSTTTSELLDIKPSNLVSSQQQKKNKRKNVDNLKDIDAILMNLELAKSNDNSRRVCNCMATRHPLFELAPNCLNCGKIICVKEGLQPCSSCGKELLNYKDKMEIIHILKQEKDQVVEKQDNPQNRKIQEKKTVLSKSKGKISYSLTAGENLWEAQDKALKQADKEAKKLTELRLQKEREEEELRKQEQELDFYKLSQTVNVDLVNAQERLDMLLNFQDTGAERTKIIDNAADFESPSASSGNLWLSPVERALQLKKQQRQSRKHEETKKERSGRGKKVLEMIIRDGKVTMVEKVGPVDTPDEQDSEIEELESQIKEGKSTNEAEMSRNVWDFEKDKNKWEKPVYTATQELQIDESFVVKNRVQFSFDPDQNELLVEMPS